MLFVEAPQDESSGTVVVFPELSGIRWDRVQLRGTP